MSNTDTKSRLTRAEAAEYLGLTVTTLEVYASRGVPPLRYSRVGKHAFYDLADLESFQRSRTRSGTSAREIRLASAGM